MKTIPRPHLYSFSLFENTKIGYYIPAGPVELHIPIYDLVEDLDNEIIHVLVKDIGLESRSWINVRSNQVYIYEQVMLSEIIHKYLVHSPYVKKFHRTEDRMIFVVEHTETQVFIDDDKLVQGMLVLLNSHPELEAYKVTMKYVGGVFVISLL